MSTLKDNKVKEIIRELAAEFFSRESNRQSLMTVTDVELKSRGSKAIILITVLPEDKEASALEFAQRRLGDFRTYVMSHSRIMRVPYFEVGIDYGEKNRQRIDELSQKI